MRFILIEDVSRNCSVSFKAIVPRGYRVASFVVDDEGNVYFRQNEEQGGRSYIVSKGGSLREITTNGRQVFMLDGTLYLNADQRVVSSGVQEILIHQDGSYELGTPVSFAGLNISGKSLQEEKSVLLSTDGQVFVSKGTISTLTRKTFSGLNLCSIRTGHANNGVLYIAGMDETSLSPVFFSCPLDESSVTYLLPKGQYEVTTFDIQSDGTIAFAAIRYKDGATILGKIPPDGEMEVLSEEFNEVKYLTRLR